MGKITYYQQGDVLLKLISALPEGLEELKTNIVQFGETTGHKHQFLDLKMVQLYAGNPGRKAVETGITADGDKFVVVKETTALTHEEHNPILVPPGIYQVDIVLEYDYEKDEVTRVVD